MIEDIRVFSTIPDETPSYLAEELLFEFHYVGRLFLFCRPPTDLPNLKRLHFAFRTGEEGPLVAKDSVLPTEEKKEGLCCIHYNADLHQKLPKAERYLNIMQHLERGIRPYAAQLELDHTYFERTFKRMRAIGFEGSRFLLDPVVLSHDGKYKASVEVVIFEGRNHFNIVFLDSDNNVVRRVQTRPDKEVICTSDNVCTLFMVVGEWKWLTQDEFVVVDMLGVSGRVASPHRDEFMYRLDYRRITRESYMKEDVRNSVVAWRKFNETFREYSIPRIVVWDGFWEMNDVE